MTRLGGPRYLAASLAVFCSQHLLLLGLLVVSQGDVSHLPWWFWVNPLRVLVGPTTGAGQPALAAAAGMVATLVVDVGLVLLAFKRATEVESRSWTAALTFVPFLQLGAMIALTFARPSRSKPPAAQEQVRLDARTSATGVLVGVGAIVITVASSTLVFGLYGYALFLISPFLISVAVAYLANRKGRLKQTQTLQIVFVAFLLAAAALLGFAIEGAICLVLASPIIAGAGLLGSWLGAGLASLGHRGRGTTLTSVAFIPLLLVSEAVLPPHAAFDNTEHIDIAAKPEAVWDAVVHMKPLIDLPEAPFRWGLAYPMRAEFQGEGVGAIRQSAFSTGEAAERVTAWRPNAELTLKVLSEPPAMRELSPYMHVNAPHVSGYFRTREETFRISSLPSGQTRLSLTSRHDLDLEPALYWMPMAQWAVRANKVRVLAHLRRQAEATVN